MRFLPRIQALQRCSLGRYSNGNATLTAYSDAHAYPLALALFDTAVNMGVGTAIKLLQRAINDLLPTDKWVTVDGKLGRQTLIATKTLDPYKLTLRLCDRREERYYAIVRANPTQRKFLKGWLNRLNDLRREIRSKP
ncbi:MAG: putative peptidoglycan-binding domain-containing protein [Armatimonadota bacterium]|jgi:lysozyme family protein